MFAEIRSTVNFDHLDKNAYKNYFNRLYHFYKGVFQSTPIKRMSLKFNHAFQSGLYDEYKAAEREIAELEAKDIFNHEERITDESACQLSDEQNDHPDLEKHPEKQLKSLEGPNKNDENTISSIELSKKKFDTIPFEGEWGEFFGKPEINFHCSIYGKPGSGKSTMAIKFAHYLAENFGKVIYISHEEGFSETLKLKVVNMGALSEDLFFSNLKTYDEIKSKISPNSYNFIFIDSVNTLRMKPEQLQEFRTINNKVAIIAINQTTKAGESRGSNEFNHDTDITIKVDSGKAIAEKNRYTENRFELTVFDKNNDNN